MIMKQLKIKFLSRLLMAVSALCMFYLTAKAQSYTLLPFLPPALQYSSMAHFDQSGNWADSTVCGWTKNGFFIGKEMYTLNDKGMQVLASTCKILSDTGNDFTTELWYINVDASGEEYLQQTVYHCDNIGEIAKAETTDMSSETPGKQVTTMQYWHSDNRLDSVLSTTIMTIPDYGDFTSTIKTIYRTYDADGRATLIEEFSSSVYDLGISSSVYKFAYFKNASGKLEREENETDQYYNGVLDFISKSTVYFDTKERAIKTEEYSGPTLATLDPVPETYFYHYDTNTGIVNPALLAQPVIANVVDGSLLVNSSKAERIEIYSVSGVQVYANAKPAGEIQIFIDQLPKGIYLVKGSSGWVKKIVR